MYPVSHHINSDIFDLLLSYFPGAYIAGGSVRDSILELKPKDYDVYFTNIEDLKKALHFVSNNKMFKPLNKQGSMSMGEKFVHNSPVFTVDIVNGLVGPVDFILSSMDYTCCQVSYTSDKKIWAYNEKTYFDILNKVLVPTNCMTVYARNSLNRAIKFVSRGWKLEHGYLDQIFHNAVKQYRE